jgi:hypothetical protein
LKFETRVFKIAIAFRVRRRDVNASIGDDDEERPARLAAITHHNTHAEECDSGNARLTNEGTREESRQEGSESVTIP